MSSFKFSRIDHVNVTTPEELIDDVCRWYETVLGLERTPKPDDVTIGGGWFRAGDQEIHISIDPHNPPRTAHYGLVVDDMDAVVRALRAAGCHIEQARSIPGRHRFYTRDPAGNRIEVTSIEEQPAVVQREET
ncbi:MAG: VOC family protein [Actinomycetota bacterium]|nr:VOC family protein [Actinomycetota bacterium]